MLLNPDGTVSRGTLTAELWGDSPPRSAAANLRNYVSGVRTWLADRCHGPAGSTLTSTGNGWALNTAGPGPVTVDVREFEADRANGRSLVQQGDLVAAESYLRRAALSCRGLPLQDVAQGALLGARAAVLTAQWFSAVEEYADLLIRLGDYERARTVLHEFLSVHPTRERAWGQLMLACYHDGDVAAVVRAYRTGREALVEELGVEPGREFTALYQAILRREAVPDGTAPVFVSAPWGRSTRTGPLGRYTTHR
ncbi:AfsR/SARP family transcriptional regulator [Sphaerisporangium dianthi]|uniref:BTAD domain-containing putative transcriptional regulator n=1 Tax=Sphaerisporangium dianthi TaxID=1436120 RepID=A0ABV9CQT1_9ACTN